MDRLGKYLSICLVVILTTSSLLMVNPINAQTSPKPSVPEFTIKYFDNSYDVPPSPTIDPYKGETMTKGYTVVNKTIEVVIEQEPANAGAGYNIRYKGHFEESWTEAFDSRYFPQSLRIAFYCSEEWGYYYHTGLLTRSVYAPSGGKVDFQVQAIVGNYIEVHTTPGPGNPRESDYRVFVGERSSWSNTYTLNLADGSVSISASPNPTSNPSPTVPELSITAIIPLFIIIPLIAFLIVKKSGTRNS